MLWVLSWRELPPCSRPIRGKLWRRFHPRNRFWRPQTSPSFGPPTCNDWKWVVNELLCEFATEFQLAQQDQRRQKCKCKHCIHRSQQVQAQTRIPLPTSSLCWGILQRRLENASDFAVVKQKEHQRICPSWKCRLELNGTPCGLVPTMTQQKQKPQESNELLPCERIKNASFVAVMMVGVSKFNGRKRRKVPNTAVCNKLGLSVPKV